MARLSLWILVLGTLTLMGCRVKSSSDDDHDPHRIPDLEAFHVVDSYGYSSEDGDDPLILDPYLDNGEFEIYWDADNTDDYEIKVRINDKPVYRDSRRISSDYCGPGLDCDRNGIQFCQYYSDFSISCDPPGSNDPGQRVTYFDDWIGNTLPEKLYLILDLCDTRTDYCEYAVRTVYVE